MDLTELAATQCGIVSVAQARACGISRDAIATRVRRGSWRRVHPRVYAVHAGPLPPCARAHAAIRYAGAGALLGFASAAALHGIGDEPAVVHVVVPHARRVAAVPGLVIHRATTLPGTDVTRRAGLPVTSVARTVVDLLLADPAAGRVALAAAVQRRLTTPERLRRTAELAGVAHWRVVREAIEDVTGGSHSALELAFLELCRAHGLPLPDRQPRVRGRHVDATLRGGRVRVELDSLAFHFSASDWERDLDRQNDLAEPGVVLLRFTWRMVRDRPERVAERIRTAVAAVDTRERLGKLRRENPDGSSPRKIAG